MHCTPAPVAMQRASAPRPIGVIGGNRSNEACAHRGHVGGCERGANACAHLHG
jgi:hypothetical protein